MHTLYLPQIPCDLHIMPLVVVESPQHRFNKGFKGPGAQIYDEGDGAIAQRQVDIVCRLARVQDETIALPSAKGKRDLVAAALNGALREVVAEILSSAECGKAFLFS